MITFRPAPPMTITRCKDHVFSMRLKRFPEPAIQQWFGYNRRDFFYMIANERAEVTSVSNEVHLFFLDKRHQFMLDAIAEINRVDVNARLIVVDVGAFDYPLQAPWRVGGVGRNRSKKVSSLFSKMGIEYIDGSKLRPPNVSLTKDEMRKLEIAIRSTVISWQQRALRPNRKPGIIETYVENRIRRQSKHLFSVAAELIRQYSASKIYLENGRFGAPHAILLAAQRKALEVTFTGSYVSNRTLYARSVRVHDRVEMQRHAMQITVDLPRKSVEKLAQTALERSNSKKTKDVGFTELWTSPWKGPNNSLALFATSSSDETDSTDLEWGASRWENQYQAFSAIWKELSDQQLTPVLRIHPNMLNKNPWSAWEELKIIKKFSKNNPEFHIVWPASTTSTYELMSFSNIVIVENSTVGQEASLQGLPIICTQSAAYDLIADVTAVYGPEDLPKIRAMDARSDPLGAQRYVAAQEILDKYIPPNPFGVNVDNFPKLKLIIPSLLDGSAISMLYEFRWRIYRVVMLKISPKNDTIR